MNVLENEKRAQIIHCLIEGWSIRATVRMTGVAKKTVLRALISLRDSADNSQHKLMTLSFDEFLRRFPLHLLPKGFVRIRNFGFFAQSSPVNLGATIT
jgi:hypothetical protein